MENQFQIFKSPEFGTIRTAGTSENPLFCLADVCRALELGNPSQVKTRLSDGVISNEVIFDNLGRKQNATFVNEDGLYDVILESRKPEARRFRKWITSEVLPTIRKTGSYSLPQVEKAVAVEKFNPVPEYHKIIKIIDKTATQLVKCFGIKYGIAFASVASMIEENHGINLKRIKELLPPAEHEIGRLNATQIGKEVGKTAQQVNKKLVELGLQEKDGHGGYILTDEGKKYAEAIPYEKNGHAGYQIKWASEVVTLLN